MAEKRGWYTCAVCGKKKLAWVESDCFKLSLCPIHVDKELAEIATRIREAGKISVAEGRKQVVTEVRSILGM